MHRTGKPNRIRFTLIELLVVVAIIAVLAAMLLPALSRTREAARRAACASQQRQFAAAIHSYADDADDAYPDHRSNTPWSMYYDSDVAVPGWANPPSKWFPSDYRQIIGAYISDPTIAYCPSFLRSTRGANRNPVAFWNGDLDEFQITLGYMVLAGYERPPGTGSLNYIRRNSKTFPIKRTQVLYAPTDANPERFVMISGMNIGSRIDRDGWETTLDDFIAHPTGNNEAFGDGHVAWVGRLDMKMQIQSSWTAWW